MNKMNKKQLEKMDDKNLIILIKTFDGEKRSSASNLAMEVLLNRYEKLIHKNWFILQKQLNNSSRVNEIKEDYYEEAYEALYKAVLKTDLSKIENDKWKFVGMAHWYIQNVRNSLLKKVLKDKGKCYLDFYFDDGDSESKNNYYVESTFWENNKETLDPSLICEKKMDIERGLKALEECYKEWTKQQRLVYELYEKGLSCLMIAKKLDTKSAYIYKTLKNLKKDIIEKVL